MINQSFISFFKSLEQAQEQVISPEITHVFQGFIQLKPKDPQPYFQATNSAISLSFDALNNAYLVDCRGDELDVTPSIKVFPFLENGIKQLLVRVAYLPNDFGSELVYLKLDVAVGASREVYFSNCFLVTDDDINRTVRFDYIDRFRSIQPTTNERPTPFQSIRLKAYYHDFADASEVSNYYQISKNQHINPRGLEKQLSEWITQPIDSITYSKLLVLMKGVFYINQVRQFLFDNPEYNERIEHSNVSENTFLTDPDEGDFLRIIPVIAGVALQDFRVNVPDVKINDPMNYLYTQTEIPVT